MDSLSPGDHFQYDNGDAADGDDGDGDGDGDDDGDGDYGDDRPMSTAPL